MQRVAGVKTYITSQISGGSGGMVKCDKSSTNHRYKRDDHPYFEGYSLFLLSSTPHLFITSVEPFISRHSPVLDRRRTNLRLHSRRYVPSRIRLAMEVHAHSTVGTRRRS